MKFQFFPPFEFINKFLKSFLKIFFLENSF